MNTLPPRTDPLDEHELPLSRIVRALPGGDPPAAIDARILRSAADSAASRRPTARWLAPAGAAWGIGGAAAAVLALGIGWQLLAPQSHDARPEAPSAARMQDSSADSSVAVEFQDPRAPAASVAAAPPPPETRRPHASAGPRAAAKQASSPPAAPEPFSDSHLDEHVAARAESGASAEVAAELAVAPAQPAAANTGMDSMARPQAALEKPLAESSAKAASATTGMLAAGSPARSRRPAAWLSDIRQLRDQGHDDEARASLSRFHTRYPGYAIPSDLRLLLRRR